MRCRAGTTYHRSVMAWLRCFSPRSRSGLFSRHRLHVDSEGHISNVRLLKSNDPTLEKYWTSVLARLTIQPAKRLGVPVAVEITFDVGFDGYGSEEAPIGLQDSAAPAPAP